MSLHNFESSDGCLFILRNFLISVGELKHESVLCELLTMLMIKLTRFSGAVFITNLINCNQAQNLSVLGDQVT